MTDIFLSPTSVAKLKNKQSALKLKNGSPKFQEVLRQRCRDRMREKRGQLFNKRRLYNEGQSVHDILAEIIRKEFSDLTTSEIKKELQQITDIPLSQDDALALENEILADEEQWILEEYERMLKIEIETDMVTEDEYYCNVICPMCQRVNLSEIPEFIICSNCGLKLPSQIKLPQLRQIMDRVINDHSSHCNETPSFNILPDSYMSLCLTCSTCSDIQIIL